MRSQILGHTMHVCRIFSLFNLWGFSLLNKKRKRAFQQTGNVHVHLRMCDGERGEEISQCSQVGTVL